MNSPTWTSASLRLRDAPEAEARSRSHGLDLKFLRCFAWSDRKGGNKEESVAVARRRHWKKKIFIYISTTGRSSVKRTSTYAGLPSIQIINENKWSNRKQGRWRFGPVDWSRSFGLCSDVFPQDHCCFIDHRSITLFTPYCHTVTVTARERKSQLELIILTLWLRAYLPLICGWPYRTRKHFLEFFPLQYSYKILINEVYSFLYLY